MATVIAGEKLTRSHVFHIIISVAMLISVLMVGLVEEQKYRTDVQKELAAARNELSSVEWDSIETRVRKRHQEYFYDNGVYDQLKGMILPKAESHVDVIANKEYLYRIMNNVQVFAYQVFYRLTTMEYWLSMLGPVLFCIVYTGYNVWRVNRYRMGGAKTSRARMYMKALWLIIICFIFLLVSPAMLNVLSVYTPAILLVLMAFTVSKYIQSFQKDV
ncbi:DUF4400 domain-containing protein [Alteromonas gilva]|uniref:DUF4400 domain-containing protein n=1 Tax=Alteromonas gilva TaxID=2987522 RepID=A0ABT5L703_9ALTE|nr:DUF4400 domain-containing protein [Alteromonas gilva]MDC8832850.1 DUF4400 domain-containing protein [Alteromonas gilva]